MRWRRWWGYSWFLEGAPKVDARELGPCCLNLEVEDSNLPDTQPRLGYMIVPLSSVSICSPFGRQSIAPLLSRRLCRLTHSGRTLGAMSRKASLKRAEDLVDFLNASPSGMRAKAIHRADRALTLVQPSMRCIPPSNAWRKPASRASGYARSARDF